LIEEMHVVTPYGQHAYAGFRAFRWIAWRLPLTMLVAPLLYVPGVPWLGNKVYRWVAKHRFQLVPCDDGGCKVPLKR
jgi:predicted DCC family thiol-disulfide oxidoreductase YuxK